MGSLSTAGHEGTDALSSPPHAPMPSATNHPSRMRCEKLMPRPRYENQEYHESKHFGLVESVTSTRGGLSLSWRQFMALAAFLGARVKLPATKYATDQP